MAIRSEAMTPNRMSYCNQKEKNMDLQRLDEVRELFGYAFKGSGCRDHQKKRLSELFNRVADALEQQLGAEVKPVEEKPETPDNKAEAGA